MTTYLRLICFLLGLLVLAGTGHAATLTRADVGGGSLSPPVAHNGYLYVGTGVTLSTWDMADPTQPAFAGRTSGSPATGPIRALAMVGDYLYAVWNSPEMTGGLIVYSLADPAHPQVVAEIEDYIEADFKRPSGLAVSANYLYIGDSENGVVVMDASDPLDPQPVTVVGGIYEFAAMAVFGDRLLTTGSNFLSDRVVNVIDISDPAAPALAGSTALDGTSVLRAALTDGYAIGVGFNLLVYDLHDPANIQQIFNTEIDLATQAIRAGNVLYLIGATGIQVWDFTTPSAPALLRTVAMDSFAPEQVVDAPFGPVILTHLDRGLVLGVVDPLNPTLASEFALPIGVAIHAAAFDASHAYFAQEGYGLSVVDPATLELVGRYDADLPFDLGARDMEDISVDGGRAYLAAWGYGVLIADLTDPAHPTELGRFPFDFATAIEAHGDRVYVASSTNGGIFRILDVSDPAAPQELGAINTSKTLDLTVRGDYAFLSDQADFGDGGLRIVDVSVPATPVVVGQELGCTYADGIDVSADGNTVYMACASDEESHGTLRIVDTTDKAHPALIGSLTLPGSATLPDYNVGHAVRVVGNVAYVGHEFGVDEVDISDPALPVQITRHETGYFVRSLAVAPDGRVFAFASEAGTYVYAADAIFANGFD
jgi:hypothetical protein